MRTVVLHSPPMKLRLRPTKTQSRSQKNVSMTATWRFGKGHVLSPRSSRSLGQGCEHEAAAHCLPHAPTQAGGAQAAGCVNRRQSNLERPPKGGFLFAQVGSQMSAFDPKRTWSPSDEVLCSHRIGKQHRM